MAQFWMTEDVARATLKRGNSVIIEVAYFTSTYDHEWGTFEGSSPEEKVVVRSITELDATLAAYEPHYRCTGIFDYDEWTFTYLTPEA